ncbi:glycoside hydrolase family 88 protein [Paenibacillus sp. TAB 01]|uniref:glycoside hydrolase family 88 protein n=1 Tax=Paenibacillus sp. TAB 01 TaxID=3368988 RepID=UPI0037533AA1
MILAIIAYGLILLAAAVLLIDALPVGIDWLQRIRIGRYDKEAVWNQAITDRGLRWLQRTPQMKVTDNTRLVVIDMLRGNYTKAAIQQWQEASLLLGLSECTRNGASPEVREQVLKYLDRKLDAGGHWRTKPEHVDAGILAYALMQFDFIDTNRYKPALDETWEMIQSHIGTDGTVEYRKFMKSYRYVDTIGFICPFLVAYGLRYQVEECVSLAVKQIKQFEQYGMLESHYLPCHVYKVDNKAPLGLYGWGRGLGWFAIGLIDAWNELPDTHKYKPVLETMVQKFAAALLRCQQSGGQWNWVVTRNEARADSSATAMLGWFLWNASRIRGISEECQEGARKAIGYLMKVTRRNGAVDFSQGDTKDIGVYSMLFNIMPFTQGFSIRCIRRMERKTDSIKHIA